MPQNTAGHHISPVRGEAFSFHTSPEILGLSYRLIWIFGIVLEGKTYFITEIHETGIDIWGHF